MKKLKVMVILAIAVNLIFSGLLFWPVILSFIKYPDLSQEVSKAQDRWEQLGEWILISNAAQIKDLSKRYEKGEDVCDELVEKYRENDALWREYWNVYIDYYDKKLFLMLRPIILSISFLFLLNSILICWIYKIKM